MDEKTERNARVQRRYDELMAAGKHGHYETMFRLVREEVESATSKLAAERDGLKQQIEVRNRLAKAREEGFTKCRAERDNLRKALDAPERDIFDLLEAVSEGLDRAGRIDASARLRAGFSRMTGGVDYEWLGQLLTTPPVTDADGGGAR